MSRFSMIVSACMAVAMVWSIGCGKEETAPAASQSYEPPVFESPDLIQGRAIWMESCARCHRTGREDSPRLGDKDEWAPRIAQGLETLYARSIEGYTNDLGDEMPPRGGNPDLSDEDVKTAVRYMVEASQ